MEFEVEIKETLSRTIRLEADSEDEAYKKVKNSYQQEEIVLDNDDYVETEFFVTPLVTNRNENNH